MYLPELTGVEFLGQFFNTPSDQGFPFFCYDQGVFILGLEVVCLLHGYKRDGPFEVVGLQIRGVLTLLLPCFVCALLALEFIKLLDGVLDVLFALFLPNARFQKLLVLAGFGEVQTQKAAAGNVAELFCEIPDQFARIVTHSISCLLHLLLVGERTTVPQPYAYH